jgi:hypothetical protein
MHVFDGRTKHGRQTGDLVADKKLPGSGSLNFGGIANVSSLAGCLGCDVQLIHGDRWIQTASNHTEMVKGDVKLTASQNQIIKVGANQTETICGTSMETVIGPHLITNMDAYNETRLGTHIQVHGGLEWVHDDEMQIHYGGLNAGFWANLVEAEVDHYEVALGHFEAKGQHNYFSGNDNNAVLVQFQTKPLNVKADTTEADINGLRTDIQGLQGRVGSLEANAHACVATAGPDPNPTVGPTC